jgi:hypothetical protein
MSRWPDFFIAGAPKAGTTALHSALVGVPGIALSSPKEPKFFLCDGRPPPRARHRGPGDAHSRKEWVWRESAYLQLWAGAQDDMALGESTPFYLHDREAHARIASVAPHAKFVVLLRDPVDRAYSNWMHLWSDGLEPESDFLHAVGLEESRRRRGWAPFWAYRDLGRYGEQLEHLYRFFDPAQVLVLRYRALVDAPDETVSSVLDFLGVPSAEPGIVPHDNTRPLRPDTFRTRSLSRLVRAGAATGAWAPPQVWRKASEPLLRELHRNGTRRPDLSPDERRQVLEPILPDIETLEQVTGQSFDDWKGESSRGSFTARVTKQSQPTSSVTRSWAPSGRASS